MVIYVKEKTLILRFYDETAKKFLTISEDGEVIDYYNPNLKIPLIIRKFNMEDVLKAYQKIQEYPVVFGSTTDIISFFEYRFDIVLNRKILVNLPEENIGEALKILEGLIKENRILEKRIKQIDLRVKGKIFVDYFKENEMNTFKLEDSITILTFKDK
jgi:cell division protein FtsQ